MAWVGALVRFRRGGARGGGRWRRDIAFGVFFNAAVGGEREWSLAARERVGAESGL